MHQPYTSDTLVHFVGWGRPADHAANFDTLSKVLASRRVSHPPHTDDGDRTAYTVDTSQPLRSEKLLVPTVTCFADIPPGSLGIHVSKYGSFGLGFRRQFLIAAGARPVTYVPVSSTDWQNAHSGGYFLKDLNATYIGFKKYYDDRIDDAGKPVSRAMGKVPTTDNEVLRALKSVLEKGILAYIKPFDAEVPVVGATSFYMEREWRKFGYLRFDLSDLVVVWVAAGYKHQVASLYPALANQIVEAVEAPTTIQAP